MIRAKRNKQLGQRIAGAIFATAITASAATAAGPYGTVSFSSVGTGAYGVGDINSCAVTLNTLTTVGNHQFIAYYDSSGAIMIGRRDTGSSAWTTFNSGITLASNLLSDDHNVIAIAVDGAGFMHVGWGMHNVALDYAISNATVTGATLSSVSFTQQTSANAPTLFPNAGSTTNEATYPQFYNIPGSNNLLFTYRNGGAGGGSGNGNQYFDVYNPATHTWTNNFVINGELTSVNAYVNRMVYTSTNNLLMTWTWRATSNWQTNSNIMFAQSPDNGASWYQQGGTTKYDLPIIQHTVSGPGGNTDTKSVAQVIANIPQGDSFINQTSMTVDNNDHPIVATYLAPGWTPTSATAGSGNPNRQYMLYFYTGAQWMSSQVSHRTSDTAVDFSGADVRDLGRPDVLVDKQGRVLVVTRSEDSAMGSYSNPATPNNGIVVYYTTTTALYAGTPNWRSVTLDAANMGSYEPTYDPALWSQTNQFNLFYEPVGLSGETTQAVQVLQWDEPAFFTAGLTWNNMGAAGDGATWDNVTNVNWNNGSGAVNFMAADNVTFNDANNGHYAVTLNSAVSPGAVTFDNSAGNYTVGGTGGIAGAGTLTKLGSGTLTISTVNTYSGDTIVSAGTLTLAAAGSIASGKVTAASGATLNVLGSLASTAAITSSGTVNFAGNSSTTASGARTIGALTINAGTVTIQSSMLPGKPMVLTTASLSGAGTLDLTNNELITTAAAAAIRGRIIAHQIISSVGAVGYLDLGNGKIEARYTLIGDADLNGAVDVGDLGALATNYGITTGGSWSGGDFNYDNMVDVGDLGALATNYGNALAGNAAATVTAVVSTSVPEPPVVALGVLARLCCLSLRRKRS